MVNNQVKINCSYSKLIPVDDVKPNPQNPNRHPDNQIELLAKILKEQGFRLPITVSNRSGFVVRGHGRLMAALKLNLTEVPIDFQDYETDELEKADLLADNKIAELANLDIPSTATVIQELEFSNFDLELTAFDATELDSFLKECLDCDKCENRESPQTDKSSSAKKNEVNDVDINSFDYYTIGFSGGKDSTAVILWALDNLPKEKLILVHWDSGWAFSEEYEYVKYVIAKYKLKAIICGERNRKYVINRIKTKGYPFYGNLWCQTEFKLRTVKNMKKYYMIPKFGKNYLSLIGIRCSESRRRQDYPDFYKSEGELCHVPIKDWTDEDLIIYFQSKDDHISPLYKMWSRSGCVFCPNNSTIMMQHIQRYMHKDLCDMNHALALDVKQNPQYSQRAIEFFLKINLHKKIDQGKKADQAFFKEIAFDNMDFAKGSPEASKYITDLRGKVPIEKKDIPKNDDFVIEV